MFLIFRKFQHDTNEHDNMNVSIISFSKNEKNIFIKIE